MLRTGLLAVCLMFALAGCGQKGDLYLPDQNENQNQQATSQVHG